MKTIHRGAVNVETSEEKKEKSTVALVLDVVRLFRGTVTSVSILKRGWIKNTRVMFDRAACEVWHVLYKYSDLYTRQSFNQHELCTAD